MKRWFALITVAAAGLVLGACGSDDDGDSSSSSVAPSVATVVEGSTDTTAPAEVTVATDVTDETHDTDTSEVDTTAVPDTTTAPTEAETTVPPTVAPDALQTLPGVAAVEVTVGGSDPTRPVFSWTVPAGATSYELVVQTAAGVPLWGWTGSETQVVLGGVERPADVEGPTLTEPSRVRVYAFDDSNILVGVSPWVTA